MVRDEQESGDSTEAADTATSFGRWVRARRTELLLTQEDLAERSGLSVRTVRNLEAGRGGVPRLETQRLAIAALRAKGEPTGGEGGPATPAQLPFGVSGFTGRTGEVRQLNALLERPGGPGVPVAISAIAGMAGVGKTALAVHWAHQVRHRFPDGQLYVDLRGYSPGAEPLRPIEALARFLHALGVPTDQVPTDLELAAGAYRTLLADRRMLVLLDNAQDPAQVRPLLPGGTGNLVLITSRDQLNGLIAREGAVRLTMGVFGADEAEDMLVRILGPERVAAEAAACAELAQLCARLPLALRIAATNLHSQPHQSVAAYAARLRPDPLGGLAIPGDAESVVRAAFDLSYLALPPNARLLFRRLGLIPGPDFTDETAAVVAGVPPAEAVVQLDALVRSHLVAPQPRGRFGCHDLLRLYARQRAEAEGGEAERQSVVARLYSHYQAMVGAAATVLYPHMKRLPEPEPTDSAAALVFDDPIQASAWLDAERPSLVAAVMYAAEHGPHSAAWRLADGLRGYFVLGMHTVDWLTSTRAALAAAQADEDWAGQAAAQLSLATLHSRLGDQAQAIDGYTAAFTLAKRAGWTDGEVASLGSLGNVHFRLGQAREAAANFTEVLAHARRSGQHATQAAVLSNLGLLSLDLGRLDQAAEQYAEALALARKVGSVNLEANSLANLGEAYTALGDYDSAWEQLTRALEIHQEIGDRDSEGFTLCNLAAVHRDRGEYKQALGLAERALALTRAAGHRRYEVDAQNALGSIRRGLGAPARAIEHHRQARLLAEETGYRYAGTTARLGQAEAHRDLRDIPAARSLLAEVLAIAEEGGYRVPEGRAYALLARLHLDEGSPRLAIEAAERAAGILRETGHRLGEAQARSVLAEAIAADTAG